MSRLFLIRHGPTHAKAMVGWSDVPADLTDSARIAALCAHLPANARLVSSDLIRTRSTADALQGPGHRRLPDEPGLREIHFGDWELKTAADIELSHPDTSRAFWTDPGPVAAPGGESWDQMADRVSETLERLANADEDLIVVAHFAVILSQIARAQGVPPREVLCHKIEPLSVTTLEVSERDRRVSAINQIL